MTHDAYMEPGCSPPTACPPARSARRPKIQVRRPRIDSNESGNSTGSGVSQDSHTPPPAIHLIPGSAPASRSSSFREQRPQVSRRSPATHSNISTASNNSNGNITTDTSSSNNYSSEGSSHAVDNANVESMGRRRNSMPNVQDHFLAVPSSEEPKDNRLRRVRSFKTTSKGGVVNRGDSFKKKSTHSLMSTGSAVTDLRQQQLQQQHANMMNNNSCLSEAPTIPTYYRVIMMGGAGTGKSSMAGQFMTSDFMGGADDNQDPHDQTVTVLLDGEESTIEFFDPSERNVIGEELCPLLDAYVVVFAINDHLSFEQARDLVRFLRVDLGTDRVILLVANKIDLVRKRKVTADEARLVAETYDCKYTETSAALNHYVDELLVGILTQIRLHMRIPFTTISFPGKDHRCRDDNQEKPSRSMKGPRGFFARLFRKSGRKKMKPCENLYTL